MRLSADDHRRVSDAIASAERTTAGEIFCVVTDETDEYRAVPFAWAALAALVLPPLMLLSGLVGPHLLAGGWQAGTAAMTAGEAVAIYAALSALLFVGVFLLVRIPSVKLRLAPRSLRQSAVHRRAMESFLAHGIHVTEDRTGVLIFLSLGERVAEIVADEAIHSRVEPDVWGAAVATLLDHVAKGRIADGFIAAIGACGEVLAAHFPPRPRNPNEIPDKLIEL